VDLWSKMLKKSKYLWNAITIFVDYGLNEVPFLIPFPFFCNLRFLVGSVVKYLKSFPVFIFAYALTIPVVLAAILHGIITDFCWRREPASSGHQETTISSWVEKIVFFRIRNRGFLRTQVSIRPCIVPLQLLKCIIGLIAFLSKPATANAYDF